MNDADTQSPDLDEFSWFMLGVSKVWGRASEGTFVNAGGDIFGWHCQCQGEV